MVFFQSLLKAFTIAVTLGFVALLLDLWNIDLFAPTVNSILGFLSVFLVILALVLWAKY